MKLYSFQTWAGLCLLILATGCGAQQTESQSADRDAASPQQAHVSSLDAPFAALSDHPQFELSDLQFPRPNSFVVRWRVISGQPTGSWSLAVKPGGNSIPTSLPLNVWDESSSGELSGELRSYAGGSTGLSLESGCEMFLTAYEGGHTFKISNSLTSGNASTTAPHPPSNEVIAQVEQQRQQDRDKQSETELQQQQAGQHPIEQNPATAASNGTPRRPQSQQPLQVSRPLGMAAVPPGISIPNGTPLIAQRGEQWLSATVVGTRDDGFVQVRWDDNSSGAEEFLHRAKLGIEPALLAELRAASGN